MNKSNLISAFKEAGFTLLEILIAITLLAFITLGVVNITENAALTMERTTEVNRNNLQIETALSRFEWDFSQIYSPLYFSTVMRVNPQANQFPVEAMAPASSEEATLPSQPALLNPEVQQYYEQLIRRFERNEHFSGVSKEGMPIPRFLAPDKDVFEFFTSSNRRKTENVKQSHFAWVRYSLAPQEVVPGQDRNPNIPASLKNLVRYFTADDPYAERKIHIEDTERVKGAVLLENVESLEFQFWEPNRRRWETSIRNIQGGEGLLRGVKLLITWYDYSGHKRSAERIFRNHWPMMVPQDQALNQPMRPNTPGVSPSPPVDDDDD